MTDIHEISTRFYNTPCTTWDAIYDDCKQATTSILCEHYIMEDDAIGQRFLDLFIAKAQSGTEINLILDGVGSRKLISSPQIAALRAAGGIVYFYKPVSLKLLLKPWRWLPRNHNKIVLIDYHIGYLGSACFHYDMCDWRDITIRFTGPIVYSLYHKIKDKKIYPFQKPDRENAPALPPDHQNSALSYAISQPNLGFNPIYKALLQRIRYARNNILLVTPYFLPPYRLRRALVKAARRGVNVTLMLSERTDVPAADCVSRSYLPYLLRHGIQVLLYRETVLHAKYVVIDDNYAMLGSTNLDYLSLLRNHETNMMIYDAQMVAELISQFHNDTQACHTADWNYWHKLPRLYRWLGRIGRMARKVM